MNQSYIFVIFLMAFARLTVNQSPTTVNTLSSVNEQTSSPTDRDETSSSSTSFFTIDESSTMQGTIPSASPTTNEKLPTTSEYASSFLTTSADEKTITSALPLSTVSSTSFDKDLTTFASPSTNDSQSTTNLLATLSTGEDNPTSLSSFTAEASTPTSISVTEIVSTLYPNTFTSGEFTSPLSEKLQSTISTFSTITETITTESPVTNIKQSTTSSASSVTAEASLPPTSPYITETNTLFSVNEQTSSPTDRAEISTSSTSLFTIDESSTVQETIPSASPTTNEKPHTTSKSTSSFLTTSADIKPITTALPDITVFSTSFEKDQTSFTPSTADEKQSTMNKFTLSSTDKDDPTTAVFTTEHGISSPTHSMDSTASSTSEQSSTILSTTEPSKKPSSSSPLPDIEKSTSTYTEPKTYPPSSPSKEVTTASKDITNQFYHTTEVTRAPKVTTVTSSATHLNQFNICVLISILMKLLVFL